MRVIEMFKNRVWFLFFLLMVLTGSYSVAADKGSCPFCDPEIIEYQKFYEDDLVIGLYTHKPVTPGHCLIIPKRHVEKFHHLHDEEIKASTDLIKRVHRAISAAFNTSPYLLLQKNGEEVGQSVPHIHIHYIPRKVGNKSRLTFLWKFFTEPLRSPISREEMKAAVEKIKEKLEEKA